MRGKSLKNSQGLGVDAEAGPSRAGRASSSDTHHSPGDCRLRIRRRRPGRRRNRGRLRSWLASGAKRACGGGAVTHGSEDERRGGRNQKQPGNGCPELAAAPASPATTSASHQLGTRGHGPGATAYELAASAVLLDAEAHPNGAQHPAAQLQVPAVELATALGSGRQPAERRLDQSYPCLRRAPALAPDARRTGDGIVRRRGQRRRHGVSPCRARPASRASGC